MSCCRWTVMRRRTLEEAVAIVSTRPHEAHEQSLGYLWADAKVEIRAIRAPCLPVCLNRIDPRGVCRCGEDAKGGPDAEEKAYGTQ